MEKELLKRKADILLDKEITIEIDIRKRTFLDKIFKRPTAKVFLVRRACIATLIFFSRLTLDLTKPDETFEKGMPALIASILNDGPLVLRIMALLIEDTDQEPSMSLVKFLGRNLEPPDQKSLLVTLLNHSRIEDFMSTTILIRKMSLLKTEELIAFEDQQDKIIGRFLAQS